MIDRTFKNEAEFVFECMIECELESKSKTSSARESKRKQEQATSSKRKQEKARERKRKQVGESENFQLLNMFKLF